MVHQLTWHTTPGLRGLLCSGFRAAEGGAPDNERGIAISLEDDDERESLLAELEMHFAAQRFANSAAAREAVKTYALERAGRKR
jgi:hypothetical protein